jgi:SNF family Na+-dependent transporter
MITTLVHLAVYILIVGIILGLIMMIIDNVPFFEPWRAIARTIVIVIGALILILLLLSIITDVPLGRLRLG